MTPPYAAAAVAAVARISVVPQILQAVAHVTGMRFAAVARVTDCQWIACAVRDEQGFGLLPGGELVLETTICNEIRQHQQPVVFGHASAHPHFSQHHTPRQYGLESYISVPIFRSDRSFFGTLCAIDSEPRDLDAPAILATVQLLADLVGRQLDMEDELARHAQHLQQMQDVQRLRELLMAIIDRDLRDPLQSIITGLYLARSAQGLALEEQANLAFMETSCQRIITLLRDLHDFAGGNVLRGTTLNPVSGDELAGELRRVLERIGTDHPGRAIHADIVLAAPVDCDRLRLARLLESLLADALAHTDPAHPVAVSADSDGGSFRMRISGHAQRDASPREDDPARLHAFIAGEIARAHGGQFQRTTQAGGALQVQFQMPATAVTGEN